LTAAKMYPHPQGYGTSLWKGPRVGDRKIDLAVAAVGARMLRRAYRNRDPEDTRQAAGNVWSYLARVGCDRVRQPERTPPWRSSSSCARTGARARTQW